MWTLVTFEELPVVPPFSFDSHSLPTGIEATLNVRGEPSLDVRGVLGDVLYSNPSSPSSGRQPVDWSLVPSRGAQPDEDDVFVLPRIDPFLAVFQVISESLASIWRACLDLDPAESGPALKAHDYVFAWEVFRKESICNIPFGKLRGNIEFSGVTANFLTQWGVTMTSRHDRFLCLGCPSKSHSYGLVVHSRGVCSKMPITPRDHREPTALSKQELRKMVLRVIYECRDGSFQGHSWGIDSVIPQWMDKYYKVTLKPEETQIAYEAVQELKTSGYLVRDATQNSDNFLVLTSRGLAALQSQKEPEVHALRLEDAISNQELLGKCINSFNDGDYETSVFVAYKHVEERVRTVSGAGPQLLGPELMTFALHPDRGVLIIPSCRLPAEQEGVYNLFKGSTQFYKNPSSHRTVRYEDRLTAIKIIGQADLLLSILSSAQRRS